MATITRSDGLQFVVQAYREIAPTTKRTTLLRDIKALSEQHGTYLYIDKKPSGDIEIVFSKEAGYLLGESIWHYFGQPKNLVYVEQLPSNDHVIVVVVRDNSIYLDSKIAIAELNAELMPLMAGSQAYRLYLYGDVDVEISKDQVEVKEILPKSVFNQLNANPRLAMKPLQLALKSRLLGTNLVPYVSSVVVLALALGGYWLLQNHPTVQLHQPVQMVAKKASPYRDYEKALTSASPVQQLNSLSALLEKVYLIPGWQVQKIIFSGQQYRIDLQSSGGDLENLLNWSKKNKFRINITNGGVYLEKEAQQNLRQPPAKIYSSQQVVALLIDELDQLLQNKSVLVGQTLQYGNAHKTELTINIKSASPEVLNLVAKEFDKLPLVIHKVDFSLNSGLIDGTIQLSVWGT